MIGPLVRARRADTVSRLMTAPLAYHRPRSSVPVPLVALCGWLVPGLGYWLIGERARAMIAGVTILLTFTAGLLIGGIRVVDVPGYDANGQWKNAILAGTGQPVSALRAAPAAEVMNKPWYIAQTLVGPANWVATWGSIAAGQAGHRQSTARIFDIGTLYTAVAGMLNLLALIDAAHRATLPIDEDGHKSEFDIGREQKRRDATVQQVDSSIAAQNAAIAESAKANPTQQNPTQPNPTRPTSPPPWPGGPS